ncbi:MAG TPA: ABC transporter permease subunit [Thermoanaerobaculia bacterium]
MKVLWANIEDVMREAAARWTLVAYFLLSTMFIIIFAFAVNLDIVDGALAGAKLFGKEVNMDGGMSIEKIVVGFEGGFSGFLYFICTFLAIFATAHLVPRMQERGTIDLYLSRPVGRVRLLLSRYIAGLILAGSNIVYLMGSMWLIVLWKTEVAHPRFLMGGVIIFFVVAVLLAFAFLVGVVTSSTAVSIMTSYALFFFGFMLAAHDQYAAMVSKDWQAWLIDTMYWVVPKSTELFMGVMTFVLEREPGGPIQVTPYSYLSTAAFGIISLALASWLFTRKEF